MNPKVRNLANLMRLKKRSGEKLVLMLGAGASLSSGVKLTSVIMQELVDNFGQDLPATDRIEDRFDRVWQRTPDATRRDFLKQYLDHAPSPGYAKLAALVEAGYFDVVLTFNFDDLVESSFNGIGFTDFGRIIRGETKDEEMQTLVDSAAPRAKIVKLHGSLGVVRPFSVRRHRDERVPEADRRPRRQGHGARSRRLRIRFRRSLSAPRVFNAWRFRRVRESVGCAARASRLPQRPEVRRSRHRRQVRRVLRGAPCRVARRAAAAA